MSWFYVDRENLVIALPLKRSIHLRKISKAWFLEYYWPEKFTRLWLSGPLPAGMYSPKGHKFGWVNRLLGQR